MNLRLRLLVILIPTVAAIVAALFAIHMDSVLDDWIALALERSASAGNLSRSLMVRRITTLTKHWQPPPRTPAETEAVWKKIVASDEEMGRALELTVAVSKTIVEVSVVDKEGVIVASSNRMRVNQPAAEPASLDGLRSQGSLERLRLLLSAQSDYEQRLPIGAGDQPVFTIQVLSSPVLWRAEFLQELRDVGIASLVAIALSVALSMVTARVALAPLQKISQSIDRIAGGAIDVAESRDEVAAVESKLLLLGSYLRGAQRDAESRRLAALGAITSGVAHEIKNPLNSIALRLELLRDRVGDETPGAQEDLSVLTQEVTRLDRVVRTFLDFTKPVKLELSPVEILELAGGVLTLIEPQARARSVELSLEGSALRVQADEQLLRQAVLNLAQNALDAMPAGGRLRIVIERTGDGLCRIEVSDTGTGISAEHRDKIFKLYFTTKAEGTGIGLAQVFRAVQLHGGTIRLDTDPGEGAKFTIDLPGVMA
jgi:signal transduction histidine kinase